MQGKGRRRVPPSRDSLKPWNLELPRSLCFAWHCFPTFDICCHFVPKPSSDVSPTLVGGFLVIMRKYKEHLLHEIYHQRVANDLGIMY